MKLKISKWEKFMILIRDMTNTWRIKKAEMEALSKTGSLSGREGRYEIVLRQKIVRSETSLCLWSGIALSVFFFPLFLIFEEALRMSILWDVEKFRRTYNTKGSEQLRLSRTKNYCSLPPARFDALQFTDFVIKRPRGRFCRHKTKSKRKNTIKCVEKKIKPILASD